ncbi:MAG: Dabb family protein [Canibacter sp.]
MLRHIVTWKMNGQTADERAKQAEEVAEALGELKDLVPTVKALTVLRNEFHKDKNWNVVLIADFADAEGLDLYDRHPEHQEVAKFVSARAASRAGIDATVS